MKTEEFFRLQWVSKAKTKRLYKLLLTEDILRLYPRPHTQYIAMLNRIYSYKEKSSRNFHIIGTVIVKLFVFVLKQESDWFDYIIPFRVAKDLKPILPLSNKMIEWHARQEINLINTRKQDGTIWHNA